MLSLWKDCVQCAPIHNAESQAAKEGKILETRTSQWEPVYASGNLLNILKTDLQQNPFPWMKKKKQEQELKRR